MHLQIAVGNANVVKIMNCIEHVGSDSGSILLGEVINGDDSVHDGSTSDPNHSIIRACPQRSGLPRNFEVHAWQKTIRGVKERAVQIQDQVGLVGFIINLVKKNAVGMLDLFHGGNLRPQNNKS